MILDDNRRILRLFVGIISNSPLDHCRATLISALAGIWCQRNPTWRKGYDKVRLAEIKRKAVATTNSWLLHGNRHANFNCLATDNMNLITCYIYIKLFDNVETKQNQIIHDMFYHSNDTIM